MSQSIQSKAKEKIVKVCKRLYRRNMLAAADGNVSIRLNDDEILITPSGVEKAFMDPKQMAVVNLKGEVLKGTPSGEVAMHLEVYRSCKEAVSVVHAHPPHAIAWSLAYPELQSLPCDILPEVLLATGSIPIVPFALPTTEDMAAQIRSFVSEHKAMILARHGALAWGTSLEEAYRGLERLEHSAQILYLAYTLGEPKPLPNDQFEKLQQMRIKIGNKTL